MISQVFGAQHAIKNVAARKGRSISLYDPYFNKIVLSIYAKQICFAIVPAVNVLQMKTHFQTAGAGKCPSVSGGQEDTGTDEKGA